MLAEEKTKSMEKQLARPASLVEGEKYLFVQRMPCLKNTTIEPVIFIGNTPCPATVIVVDQQLRRLYCDKGNLFVEDFE